MDNCCSTCYYCRPDFGTGWSGPRCALGRNLYTENTDDCHLYVKNDRETKLAMMAKALRKEMDGEMPDNIRYFNPFCMVANVFPQYQLKKMPEETLNLLLQFAEQISHDMRYYYGDTLEEIRRWEDNPNNGTK